MRSDFREGDIELGKSRDGFVIEISLETVLRISMGSEAEAHPSGGKCIMGCRHRKAGGVFWSLTCLLREL